MVRLGAVELSFRVLSFPNNYDHRYGNEDQALQDVGTVEDLRPLLLHIWQYTAHNLLKIEHHRYECDLILDDVQGCGKDHPSYAIRQEHLNYAYFKIEKS